MSGTCEVWNLLTSCVYIFKKNDLNVGVKMKQGSERKYNLGNGRKKPSFDHIDG